MSAESIRRDIVVVGASAGGVEALTRFVRGFVLGFPGAVFIVLHVAADRSVLPGILGRGTELPVAHAVDGDVIEAGRISVAPPDRHLLLEPGRARVVSTPRENGHRPGIDALFRSAASAYGERVVGVLLSGTLRDGTMGLEAIKRGSGLSLVQDPRDALYPGMPQSAISHQPPDLVGTVDELAQFVIALAALGAQSPFLIDQLEEPAPAGT
jgi:two-component system, chemotaxis family, protein-glutamate methylesterase/glutaminase